MQIFANYPPSLWKLPVGYKCWLPNICKQRVLQKSSHRSQPREPWRNSGWSKQAACCQATPTAAAPRGGPWGDSGWERAGHGPRQLRCLSREWFQWAQTLASSILRKALNLLTWDVWVFLVVIFWSSNYLVLVAQPPMHPGSALTSSEQSLRVYPTGHVPGLSPQFCPQNKTQFSTFRLCVVFSSQWPLTPHRNGRQISVSVPHGVLPTTLYAHTDCAC